MAQSILDHSPTYLRTPVPLFGGGVSEIHTIYSKLSSISTIHRLPPRFNCSRSSQKSPVPMIWKSLLCLLVGFVAGRGFFLSSSRREAEPGALKFSSPKGLSSNKTDAAFLWQGKLAQAGASSSVLLKNGGPTLALDTMKQHPHDPDIVAAALEIILALVKDDVATRNQLREKGAAEAILTAMRDFPSSPTLQDRGLCALSSLTEDNSHTIKGVEWVVKVMRKFHEDGQIHFTAMQTMANLIDDEGNTKRLIEAGAIESIATVMINFSGNMKVQFSAMAVMDAFVTKNEANRRKLADAGAFKPVLDLLEKHPSEWSLVTATRIFPGLWKRTMPVLSNIADHFNQYERKVVVQNETAELLVKVLRDNTDKQFQQSTLGVIAKFCLNHEKNIVKFGENGACEVIVKTMLSFTEAKDVWERAVDAIILLAEREDNRVRFGEAGVCELLPAPSPYRGNSNRYYPENEYDDKVAKAKEILKCVYVAAKSGSRK